MINLWRVLILINSQYFSLTLRYSLFVLLSHMLPFELSSLLSLRACSFTYSLSEMKTPFHTTTPSYARWPFFLLFFVRLFSKTKTSIRVSLTILRQLVSFLYSCQEWPDYPNFGELWGELFDGNNVYADQFFFSRGKIPKCHAHFPMKYIPACTARRAHYMA